MINRENRYIGFILLLGLIVLGYSIVEIWKQFSTIQALFPYPFIDWLVMLLLFILCRSLPVYIAEDKTIDISFVPVVASTMIFGLYPTILLFFLSLLLFLQQMKLQINIVISYYGLQKKSCLIQQILFYLSL
jgi:hypothetical protein